MHHIKWEILAALVLKIALITVLWWLFFSHPIAPTLDTHSLQQHFFSAIPSHRSLNHAAS